MNIFRYSREDLEQKKQRFVEEILRLEQEAAFESPAVRQQMQQEIRRHQTSVVFLEEDLYEMSV